jgi:bifunctional DNase/RNase
MVNISSLNNSEITKVSITDINGRVVKEVNSNVSNISVGDLNAGIYFLKVTTSEGVGTSKFVKN